MIRRSTTLVIMLGAWLANGGIAFAQVQAEVDWLFWKQTNRDSSTIISGPDGFSTGDIDFDYQSGYRLALSGGEDWWEIEAIFAQIDSWDDSQTRTLLSELDFDNSGAGNTFGFSGALFDAANYFENGGDDETTETEQLLAGATSVLRASSRYRDFELNFNTNRTAAWYRFGLGWRNLRFDENAALITSGTFDAVDVSGPPNNNALSDTALSDAGYTNLSGGADGYDGGGVDDLLLYYNSSADNELNGLQAVFACKLIPGDVVYIEGVAKAGLYHNRVEARTTELLVGSGDDDSVYGQSFTDQKGTGAFVGSLGLRGLIPVTDYINLVTGYEVLFLSGVALGTEQFKGVRQDVLGGTIFTAQADGSTILHGGKLGLEVLW